MFSTCIQRFILYVYGSRASFGHLLRELGFFLGKCVTLGGSTSASAPLASAEQSMLGTVRSEALLTDRAAHYVCYLGNSSRDRIITVRATEHGTAMSLLKVCQTYPCKDKPELQRVCQIARAELRRGVSEHAVIAALLAEHGAGAAGAALAAQEGDANTCSIPVATVDEAKIAAHSEPLSLIDVRSLPRVSTMEAPRSPPMAAPDTPP